MEIPWDGMGQDELLWNGMGWNRKICLMDNPAYVYSNFIKWLSR